MEARLPQPKAVAIAIPETSPMAQPVRQCVVALAARPLSDSGGTAGCEAASIAKNIAAAVLRSRPATRDGCTQLMTYADPMRWIVDAMNVIGTRPDAWWKDRHGAMVRLVDMLERWVATSGEDVTVVFERPPSPPISSTVVEVAHAPRPRPNSADDEIARRLASDPRPGE